MTTKDQKHKILITTAIDYVNDVIHIGHAYQKLLADCTARYFRNVYGEDNVYFVTGTDEHGQKVFNVAKQAGLDVKTFVDKVSLADQKEQDSLNISYDRFIRTTDEDHKKEAQDFFEKSFKNGFVYKGTYSGLYCEGCEAFKTQKDLVDGKCEFHPNKDISTIKDENYFFKWTAFKDFLKTHFEENKRFVLPIQRYNEMFAFIDELEDIPVSRLRERLPWGIDVPVDSAHVIWVWFDALVNYFTFGKQKGIWNEDTKIIHFLGKDNARMHALLWPAMLKSVGHALPDTIYVNGFLGINGQKVSKSLGNVIKPTELVSKYGVDAVRYYFLRYGPIIEDSDFSIQVFENVYNADLANGLGNTCARLAKLASNLNEELLITPILTQVWQQEWAKSFEDFRVDLVLANIWKKLSDLDKHINQNEPWKITDKEKLKPILQTELNQLFEIITIVEPFIPQTSKTLQQHFSQKNIQPLAPIFPRL